MSRFIVIITLLFIASITSAVEQPTEQDINALKIAPENCHAFYQLGCAYTAMSQFDEAIKYLSKAINQKDSYREEIQNDDALIPLKGLASFQKLIA